MVFFKKVVGICTSSFRYPPAEYVFVAAVSLSRRTAEQYFFRPASLIPLPLLNFSSPAISSIRSCAQPKRRLHAYSFQDARRLLSGLKRLAGSVALFEERRIDICSSITTLSFDPPPGQPRSLSQAQSPIVFTLTWNMSQRHPPTAFLIDDTMSY